MTDDKNTASLKQEESFKEQLDKKAQKPESPQPNPIVEKITEYVPGAAKILGQKEQAEPESNREQPPGPPERPHHDHKIEEFVRDQHRSKGEDGDLKAVAE